jgi:hypothetical protein
MPVKTYSIPDKDKEDVALIDNVSKYCKKHHVNMSGLVVSLLKTWAKEKGITHEPTR